VENFSYSQAWPRRDGGICWLHTRYQDDLRGLYFSGTRNGCEWDERRQLAYIERGNYQVSGTDGRKIATAFDFHPQDGGLNARTNLYYLETGDGGATWQAASGQTVSPPLREIQNPALIRDYRSEGKLVYLKDIAFDRAGRPVIFFLTSYGALSGPANGPREWVLAHWQGREWEYRSFGEASHNYDHGSLYIEEDGTWRIIAPTEKGPQEWGTGGVVTIHTSRDEGRSWQKIRSFPTFHGRNQTYVRKPLHAHPDFYALWADGDAYSPSLSSLYFCTRDGALFRLPESMASGLCEAEQIG